jgi:hypothetical protein
MKEMNTVRDKPSINRNGSLQTGIPRTWLVLHGFKKWYNIKLLSDESLRILAPLHLNGKDGNEPH